MSRVSRATGVWALGLALQGVGLAVAAEPYPLVDGLAPARLLALQRAAATRAGLASAVLQDRLQSGQLGPKVMVLPAGRFRMGSGERPQEQPVHSRQVDSFGLMKTEVTVAEYLACVAAGGCSEPDWREPGSKYHHQTSSDSYYRKLGPALTAPNSPIVGVSWLNATQYAAWLSSQTRQTYQLASEAQWEYAARAGATGHWSFGDQQAQLGAHAWHSGNSGGSIHAVATKAANTWGLHDLHGNVWEWVQDCWHDNYTGAPDTAAPWEAGCAQGPRVLRGGSWNLYPKILRAANREAGAPGLRVISIGFRLARVL